MTNLVRCKLCGYIMDAALVKDTCPACGYSAKMFEPYVDRVEPYRRRILDLDIHPIIVHAPQALTFILLLLVPLSRVLPAAWTDHLHKAITVMGLLLPPTIIGTYLSGLLDGKMRFMKLATPMLRNKMTGGILFLLCSLAMAYFTTFTAWQTGRSFLMLNIVNVLAFCCSMWLGTIGVRLMQSIFIKLGPAKPAAQPVKSAP